MKKFWYAIYTKANCEKKVAALLAKRKIVNYCPLNRIVTDNQSIKRKTSYVPLLSSFVFVHITEAEMDAIKQTNCVINFVYWLGKPAVIKNDEIDNLQHFTKEYSNVKIEKTLVNVEAPARIFSEPQIDINGKLMSVINTHIKLTLPSLGYIVTAEVDKSNVDLFSYGYSRSKMVS